MFKILFRGLMQRHISTRSRRNKRVRKNCADGRRLLMKAAPRCRVSFLGNEVACTRSSWLGCHGPSVVRVLFRWWRVLGKAVGTVDGVQHGVLVRLK